MQFFPLYNSQSCWFTLLGGSGTVHKDELGFMEKKGFKSNRWLQGVGRERQTRYWKCQIKYISKIPTVSQQVWRRRQPPHPRLCPRHAGLGSGLFLHGHSQTLRKTTEKYSCPSQCREKSPRTETHRLPETSEESVADGEIW